MSYIDRDTYGPAYEEYLRLEPGATFTASVYCYSGKPKWQHYGTASLLGAITDVFPLNTHSKMAASELWDLSIRFTKSLSQPINGRNVLCIGFGADGPNGEFLPVRHFEIGWCGQNLTYARMLIRDYQLFGHKDSLELALEILDAWAQDAVTQNGLLYVHFQKIGTDEGRIVDTCNLGNAAQEFLRCYISLEQIDIHKPEYLNAAKGVCNFFISARDGSAGFGKAWDITTGKCVNDEGTVGAFLILPLLELYEYTGDILYLAVAQAAFRFYQDRDLNNFRCMAGALDTDCIDKETSGPMLLSALKLYDLTGEAAYLDSALKAAYYFSSYMYCYDVPYSADRDFSRYGFSTCGATAVSMQHHHVDAWGLYLAPAYAKLAELTGDAIWQKRAKAMWDCFTVCVADDHTYIHGRKRPIGSQNEGWMHARWNTRLQDPRAGSMNNWLVAWPAAFRMVAIDALRNCAWLDE